MNSVDLPNETGPGRGSLESSDSMSSLEGESNKPSAFLKAIIEEYQRDAGLVAEDSNIGKIFFTIVSLYLPREYRQHAIIVSQSSAGKSFLSNRIVKPFGDKLLSFTRFTGPALERYKESFDGKIFLYQQAQGNEPFQIRPLLSEGKLDLLVVERDENGRFETKTISLNGLPVFITTTTNPDLDAEFMNRALNLTLDESEEQTARIMHQIALEASTLRETNLKKFPLISQIKNTLEQVRAETIHQLIVPYATKLKSHLHLPEWLDMRRDLEKFLKVIQAIAYAKSVCQRGYYEKPTGVQGISQKVIIANAEDLKDAIYLFGGNLDELVYRLPALSKRILDILRDSVTKDLEGESYAKLTTKEIFRKLGRVNTRTAYKYLERLVRDGVVFKEHTGIGNSYYYQAMTEDERIKLERIDFDVEAWIKERLDKGELEFKPVIPIDFLKDSDMKTEPEDDHEPKTLIEPLSPRELMNPLGYLHSYFRKEKSVGAIRVKDDLLSAGFTEDQIAGALGHLERQDFIYYQDEVYSVTTLRQNTGGLRLKVCLHEMMRE